MLLIFINSKPLIFAINDISYIHYCSTSFEIIDLWWKPISFKSFWEFKVNSHLFNCHFKVTHFHPAASIFKVRHHRGVWVFFSWKSLTPTLNMKNSGDFDPISKCLLRKKKLPTYLFLAKCLYRHCKQRHLFSRKLIDVFRFQYVQEIFTNFFRILISYLWWFFWPIEKI